MNRPISPADMRDWANRIWKECRDEAWKEEETMTQEQPEQEPVAWMVYTQDGQSVYITDNPMDIQDRQQVLPLYTTPPQRPWVGLTDEDEIPWDGVDAKSFARAIEAKLKEKNA